MKFRYRNEKPPDAKMVCHVGLYDVWTEQNDGKICATSHNGGYSWAPLNRGNFTGVTMTFEQFVARYHNSTVKRPMVEAMRKGREALMDPSISPGSRMAKSG